MNPHLKALIELQNSYKGSIRLTFPGCTRRDIKNNLNKALNEAKERYNKMLLSEVLEKLSLLKAEYTAIADPYPPIEYDDCTVNFGSVMWYDAHLDDRLAANPQERTEDQIDADHKRVNQIVEEANAIFKEHNLEQFLFEKDSSYWLGVYPEPYASIY